MVSVVADLKGKHAHIIGKLPTRIQTRVVSRAPGVIRVGVTATVPPSHVETSSGKVSDKLPMYNIDFIFQMNYIGDHWLLYFVEDIE